VRRAEHDDEGNDEPGARVPGAVGCSTVRFVEKAIANHSSAQAPQHPQITTTIAARTSSSVPTVCRAVAAGDRDVAAASGCPRCDAPRPEGSGPAMPRTIVGCIARPCASSRPVAVAVAVLAVPSLASAAKKVDARHGPVPGVDLHGCDLSHRQFEHVNLTGANLSQAKPHRTSLFNAGSSARTSRAPT